MNPAEAMLAQIQGTTPDTAEDIYQQLYPYCTQGSMGRTDATRLCTAILHLQAKTRAPVIRSYCLLYLSELAAMVE